LEALNRKDNLEDIDVGRKKVVKWKLKNSVMMWIGLISLRLEIRVRPL
jgi:hypothetical protein